MDKKKTIILILIGLIVVAVIAGGVLLPTHQPQNTPVEQEVAAVAVEAKKTVEEVKPVETPVQQAPVEEAVAVVEPFTEDKFTQQFRNVLSFPLNEAKLIAFVQAARHVEKINNKWDVQIAGAESAKMAIEYNNFAVEENVEAMKTMKGITIAEYNEMTQLTAKNAEFAHVYTAYRQLAEENALQELNKVVEPTVESVAANNAANATEQAPMPSEAVAGSDTVPAPQGSPAPQYSPQ